MWEPGRCTQATGSVCPLTWGGLRRGPSRGTHCLGGTGKGGGESLGVGAPPRPSPGETAQDPSAPGVLPAILSTHWVAMSADTPSPVLGQKEVQKLETEAQQGCSSGAWGASGSPAAPQASRGIALCLRPSHKGWSHWIQA